jgi:GNAT superfamily N-acetyltransferase
MMADLEIVRYEPALRETVLDLQTHLWGQHRAANTAELAWKYFEGPYAGSSRIYVALRNDRAVAMRGFMGGRWEAGSAGQVFDLLSAGDLVIHPDHRGRGLFTELMQHAMADLEGGCPYVLNLSAGSATRLGSLTMGWRDAGPIPRLAGGARARRKAPRPGILARLFGRAALPVKDAFARLDARGRGAGSTLAGGITVSDSARPEAMARLVRRLGHDGRIRHVRDEAYFAWRFRHPRGRYRFLFKDGDDLEAYLVLHAKARSALAPSNPVSAVTIVDCEPSGGPHASALLAAALAPRDLSRVRAWAAAFAADAVDTLAGHGLREASVKSFAGPFQSLLIRPATPHVPDRPWLLGGVDLLDLRRWDLRPLYSDGY